jgi:hypothetical protein
MVKNNQIPIEVNKKPFETVYELKNEVEEIRLPKLSEIADRNGKVKLPSEFIKKLRDPNARFKVDLIVCPVGIEDWKVLEVPCMSAGCSDTDPGYWRHGNCRYSYPDRIQWSTHARLKCPSCYTIANIDGWSFSCHGSGCTNTTANLSTLTDAALVALGNKGVSQEFVALFLRNAKEIYRNK